MQFMSLIIDRLREHPALAAYHSILAPSPGERAPEIVLDESTEMKFLVACDNGFATQFSTSSPNDNTFLIHVHCTWVFEEASRLTFSFTIEDEGLYRLCDEILTDLQCDAYLHGELFVEDLWESLDEFEAISHEVQRTRWTPSTAIA